MPKRTRSYDGDLIASLENPVEAAAYLNAQLEDDREDTEELFLLALRDVVKAHGFDKVARGCGLEQETLAKILSADGNPELVSLLFLLKVMGFRLSVTTKK